MKQLVLSHIDKLKFYVNLNFSSVWHFSSGYCNSNNFGSNLSSFGLAQVKLVQFISKYCKVIVYFNFLKLNKQFRKREYNMPLDRQNIHSEKRKIDIHAIVPYRVTKSY